MKFKYRHPELFEDWEETDYSQYDGRLILWGAGKVGGMAAHCLKRRHIRFNAFCDIAAEKWGTQYCDHPVISPEELKRDYADAAVVITNVFTGGTCSKLAELGIQKRLDCVGLFLEFDFEGYDFWMSPEFASRIVEDYLRNLLLYSKKIRFPDRFFLSVTSRCSLRCRNCDAYIPYVTNPRDYDCETIIDDCRKVLDVLGHVQIVDVMGGEPMLHTRLWDILHYLRGEERVERFNLITNGTVLPDPPVLELMKTPKFLMRISDYGSLSSKKEELAALLRANGVRYEITNYTYWDPLPRFGKTGETPDQLTTKFRDCTTNLFYLRNSKLAYCSVLSGMSDLDEEILPGSDQNYLYLAGERAKADPQGEILAFLNRMQSGRFIEACKYCPGSRCLQFENKVPVAEQAKGPLRFDKIARED